jgi:hypothetical protein
MTHAPSERESVRADAPSTAALDGAAEPGREEPPAEAAPEDTEGERPRKERVLHTRVPAVLEHELKRLATNLKVPVSNLVRAILEDAIDAVDVVGKKAEGELLGIADRLHRQRDSLRTAAVRSATDRVQANEDQNRAEGSTSGCPAATEALAGVLGFQALVLASDARCTVCERTLSRGETACRGVREGDGPRVLVAGHCALVPSAAS